MHLVAHDPEVIWDTGPAGIVTPSIAAGKNWWFTHSGTVGNFHDAALTPYPEKAVFDAGKGSVWFKIPLNGADKLRLVGGMKVVAAGGTAGVTSCGLRVAGVGLYNYDTASPYFSDPTFTIKPAVDWTGTEVEEWGAPIRISAFGWGVTAGTMLNVSDLANLGANICDPALVRFGTPTNGDVVNWGVDIGKWGTGGAPGTSVTYEHGLWCSGIQCIWLAMVLVHTGAGATTPTIAGQVVALRHHVSNGGPN